MAQGPPIPFPPMDAVEVITPWVVGPLLDIFLSGFTLSMAISYFYDSRQLRLIALLIRSKTNQWKTTTTTNGRWASTSLQTLVAVVTILSTIKTFCAIYIVMEVAVVHNGDEDRLARLAYTDWVGHGKISGIIHAYITAHISGPLLTSLVGLSVQSFYINRLNTLLRAQDRSFLSSLWFRWLLMTLIVLLALASVALAAVTTQLITTPKFFTMDAFFGAHLGTMTGGDALVTLFTIVCMLRTSQRVVASERSASLISRIVRVTVFSAALPATFALVNLVLILAKTQHSRRWHIVANFAMGKAYVFSLMWTLNYRKRVVNESIDNARQDNDDALPTQKSGEPIHQRFQRGNTSSFARTVSYYDIELQKPTLN